MPGQCLRHSICNQIFDRDDAHLICSTDFDYADPFLVRQSVHQSAANHFDTKAKPGMEQALGEPTLVGTLKSQFLELREELRLPWADKIKIARRYLTTGEKLDRCPTDQDRRLIASRAQSPNSSRQKR